MELSAETIEQNLREVREKVAEACRKSGRNPEDVKVLAVSKTKPVEDIRAAMSIGQHAFGEGKLKVSVNYTVPEGRDVSKLQVYHIVDGKKVPIQSSYSDGRLSFDVDSLSYFAVAYDSESGGNGGQSSMMLYIAIGAVAAIAAVGAVFLFLRKNRSRI